MQTSIISNLAFPTLEPVIAGLRVLVDETCVQTIDLRIQVGPLSVGRGEEQDIRIDHGRVSRHHCILRRETRDRWAIEDIGSSNGTFISLRDEFGPFERVNWHYLDFGSRIRLGSEVDLVPLLDSEMRTEPDLSRFREQLQQTLVWHGAPQAEVLDSSEEIQHWRQHREAV